MSKIKIMSSDLASKIAAGEVIENQASVIKELVENSIDAQASKIEINLIDYGYQLIQVIDNGLGMSKEDILLCFNEHATSKLYDEYSLFNIKSLGFRGEALASIKSIAKVKLSSYDGHDQGYNYNVNDDILNEGYLRQGTNISVYNLFYNVPARLKYLQSQKSEYSNIINIISKFALMYPQIAFSLSNDAKLSLNTKGNNNLLEVISDIYSLDIAKNMHKITNENTDFKIEGYVSNNQATKSNKKAINIFINNRLVYNNSLINAIIKGYNEYLMEKRYPVIIINIECDYQLIDVNVHPAKLEVRISKEEELCDLIEASIKQAFNVKQKEFISYAKPIQPTMDFSYQVQDASPKINYPGGQVKQSETYKEEVELIKPQPIKEEWIPQVKQEPIKQEVNINFDVIGQFDATYILAQNEKGLHLIDQHAAMERINYEAYIQRLKDEKIEYHNLIVPIVIPLTLSEKIKVVELTKQLSEVGINIEQQANNDIIIRQVPSWIDLDNVNNYVENIIDYVLNIKNIKIIDIKKESMIMASCKMSLKANKVLSHNEQVSLVNTLISTKNYDHCPHGRPIIVSFSKYDIEKLFKRVL